MFGQNRWRLPSVLAGVSSPSGQIGRICRLLVSAVLASPSFGIEGEVM